MPEQKRGQRQSADYKRADQWGRDSPPCDPCELLQRQLEKEGKTGTVSNARLIRWLVQQGPEAILGLGPAMLLLRVASFINRKSGTAWIGRWTLAGLTDRSRKQLDRDARALTASWWTDTGHWWPPLFRVELRGWGEKRRVHWTPLKKGWVAFLDMLGERAKLVKEDLQTRREARKNYPRVRG